MKMSVLDIQNLMVFYENAIAINNVSLECEEGEITGAFGANSAGKSTLMYTISGIILDVQRKEEMRGGERISVLGNIYYKGDDVIHMEASERAKQGIILCPERRRVFAESSVMENLKIGGILASRKQAKKTLEYIFNIFPALRHLRRRKAGFLSGGEQQMLAVSRALMAQPKLLLLDEPLLGLSPVMEEVLLDAVVEINKKGVSILISEQYARPVFPVVHNGYILENGTVILKGTSQELLSNPDVKSAYFGI